MTRPLQTQVSAGFSAGDGSSIELLIENDPGAYIDTDVHLLLFPAVDAFLAVSAGSIRKSGTKVVDVPQGVAIFSGGSSASLPKRPKGDTPTFQTLYSFDTQGNPSAIGFTYDSTQGALVANSECYAAVAYTAYKSEAMRLTYTPLVERLGAGVRTTFGVVAAFYPPRSQTIYQVQPFNVDEGNVEVELYRIVSYAVTNNDGEFERPPNYPASGAYADRDLVLDTSQTLETERVHEIGYMDQRGRAWVRSLYVPTKEPYIGDAEYKPTKVCKVSTIPAGLFGKDLIARAANFIAQRGYGCKGGTGA